MSEESLAANFMTIRSLACKNGDVSAISCVYRGKVVKLETDHYV